MSFWAWFFLSLAAMLIWAGGLVCWALCAAAKRADQLADQGFLADDEECRTTEVASYGRHGDNRDNS